MPTIKKKSPKVAKGTRKAPAVYKKDKHYDFLVETSENIMVHIDSMIPKGGNVGISPLLCDLVNTYVNIQRYLHENL